jgi:urease beta subunit
MKNFFYSIIFLVSVLFLSTGCTNLDEFGLNKSTTPADTKSNCLLSDIRISAGIFSDTFNPNIEKFRAEVSSSTDSVRVTPAGTDTGAAVTVNNKVVKINTESEEIPLVIGKNWITVNVTAADGISKKTYTLECVKLPEKSKNGFLSGINLSEGYTSPVFSRTIYNYTAEVSQSVSSITVTPMAAGVNETIRVNGTVVASGSASEDIDLLTGANSITVSTQSEDGTTQLEYAIVVTRLSGISSNTNLSGLLTSSGKLKPAFDPSVQLYTLLTTSSFAAVTPFSAGSNQTIMVNGVVTAHGTPSALLSADSTVVVKVQAENEDVKNYRITIVQDTTPPAAGTISASMIESRFITLNWTAATDNLSDKSDISYSLYKSSGADISTVANAEINGIQIKQYSKNSLEGQAVKLAINTNYSFTVIAKDEAGNKSVYPVLLVKTKGAFQSMSFDGQLKSMIINGSTLYVGGSFRSVGINCPNGAVLNLSDSQPSFIPEADSGVNVSIPDGEGGWYIGGYFTHVMGVSRNGIAHISSDGTLDEWNPDADNAVLTLFICGSTVYAGGEFSSIGGQTRNRIAALDITTGSATAWDPNANNSVYTLAISGSTVYAGGEFTTIGCQTRNRIAALDITTGNATTWNPSANGLVKTLAISGSTVYAGGEFTTIGGQTRNRIAALDVMTGNATAWNPNANGFVYTLAISGSTVYAGGQFTNIGGQTRNRIAALDITTGSATAWDPNANNSVYTLAISGSTVYAGGQFTTIGGQTRNRIAALDITTGNATTWNPSANGLVKTLAISGSTVYAGGWFTGIGCQTRNNIAAFDITTGSVTAWDPNANSSVCTLAISGSTVYAGGDFSSIGGQTRNRIAALDITTGNATTWDPNANNSVYTLAISGSTVYAGGEFSSIGGQTRNRIAALDITTGNATTWDPNANSSVCTLAISGSTVYAGGDFSSIGGQTRNRIAALDITTGNATTWNPNAIGYVNTLAISGSSVYAGGFFTSIGGQTRNNIAALDVTTGNATSWSPNADNGVRTLAISGSTVYAGGDFSSIGGQTRNRIAALDITTGNATAWNPNANGLVYTLSISGSTVYASGEHTTIGNYGRSNFAAIDAVTGEPK